MNAIVCMDVNRGIGKKGELLFHIPEDLARFKQLTIGSTVIYGRKTLDTLPNHQPLIGRRNIILTHQNLQIPNAIICHSVEEVMRELLDSNNFYTYVIGGESVYRALLPYCNIIYATVVNTVIKDADAFFPMLDEGWNHITEAPYLMHFGDNYQVIRDSQHYVNLYDRWDYNKDPTRISYFFSIYYRGANIAETPYLEAKDVIV